MLLKVPGYRDRKRSDEDLLKEFSSTGDLNVLGELYSEYMHLVYGVCLKYLKNRDESMDSVMQIFEKLIIELPKHKVDNFRSWLHVVAKNFCLMKLRAQKTYEERLNEWMNDPLIFMENRIILHPIDENEKAQQQEIERALALCMERLKKEQKECIHLFYLENRCYNEIAETMGIDEKMVKSHLQNAKRNLKICIGEKNVR